MYIAHINERTGKAQSVKEHSENVAMMCEEFAIPELQPLCRSIGMLHDLGKFCRRFQERIHGENVRVDHSTAGAVTAREIYQSLTAMIMGFCIAGHHSGLPDAGTAADFAREDHASTLYARIAQKEKRCAKDLGENFDAYQEEIPIPEIDEEKLADFLMKDCKDQNDLIDKLAFIVRYCFSCLVDADSIDTGNFCETRTDDMLQADFVKCLEKVNEKIKSFVCETELQKARGRLQKQAFSKARQDAEIYLLNMPTGSGKTLCSIKFALERAIKQKKKRIIYVIPYNNIIDQTVSEFEDIFGSDAQILRHQSSFSYENIEDLEEDYRNALKNGTENWDANSIIITTAVQFFESAYSDKRAKLRKLHNIGDAVLVFDEAHLMPMNYLQPCLQAVSYAVRYLHSEALFLTATMPDFEDLLKRYTIAENRVLNLIEDTADFRFFEKCRFQNIGAVTKEELLMKVKQPASVLVVTNSKKAARQLYDLTEGEKYYLSTYLTAVDRKRIITEIKGKLAALANDFPESKEVPEERRIKVFSTSLIEAGVDLDFAQVFRELNGLDSILQCGGRCNREGKREHAVTYIFSLEDEELRTKETEASELTKGLFCQYEDVLNPKCIREYYDRLFGMNLEKITGNTMSRRCSEHSLNFRHIPFRTYAEKFHLIDDRTESVVIPQDETGRKLVNALRYQEYISIRKLQKYACAVSKNELEELMRHGVIQDFGRGVYCLANEDYYDPDTGIRIAFNDYFL